MMLKSNRIAALIVVTVALPFGAAHSQLAARSQHLPQPQRSPRPASSSMRSDRSVDACTDFYQFACGGWMAKNPVPADRPRWGRFDELQERNHDDAARHPREGAPAERRTPSSKKIGDYYAACMDEAAIEAKGAAPLEPLLERDRRAIKRQAELAAAGRRAAHASASTRSSASAREPDFKDATEVIAIVDQGGLGLPDRDYYLKDDARVGGAAQAVRRARREDVRAGSATRREARGRAARQRDGDRDRAGEGARSTRVSAATRTSIYHKMTRAELQALTPQLRVERVLRGRRRARRSTRSTSTEPDFFKALERRSLATTPLDDWKTYLRWHVAARQRRRSCRRAFVNENFDFYGKTLPGRKELRPRWKRCVQRGRRPRRGARPAFVEETFGAAGQGATC